MLTIELWRECGHAGSVPDLSRAIEPRYEKRVSKIIMPFAASCFNCRPTEVLGAQSFRYEYEHCVERIHAAPGESWRGEKLLPDGPQNPLLRPKGAIAPGFLALRLR